jgi:hypothetical protein
MPHAEKPAGDNPDLDKFIDGVRARQRNIVFPDTVRNERPLFDFFWNGAPDPPMVQRIGAWMAGLFLVVAGLFAALSARDGGNWLRLTTSLISVCLGIRIFRNGFPRKRG